MQTRRFCWSSLVWGVIFTAAGVLLMTNGVGLVTRLDWIVPIFLILVAFGLFASAVGRRPQPVQLSPAAVPPPPWGGTSGAPASGSAPSGVDASGGETES